MTFFWDVPDSFKSTWTYVTYDAIDDPTLPKKDLPEDIPDGDIEPSEPDPDPTADEPQEDPA